MTSYVALLRGINVGGNRRVPMLDLRRLLTGAGFDDVRSYLASGNILLTSDDPASTVADRMERAISGGFGFDVDVIVRSADEWHAYLHDVAFEEQGDGAPNLLMLMVGKQPAIDEHVQVLRTRASQNERVERRGDALWLFYGDGSGRSNMSNTPVAGIWTTRNLRSVRAIAAMLTAAPDGQA